MTITTQIQKAIQAKIDAKRAEAEASECPIKRHGLQMVACGMESALIEVQRAEIDALLSAIQEVSA